ncbi:hypothetical protein GGTG_12507 [Gaeumannomyces tritici R3-111a-1]|uniref:LysM domain-containing protein n=1 Tax=Gaeumannomyces tritici (strain R3-111a-1) TaxID=644352 RepID=J3PG83_GAET3|nr:hypothetical protein GGTG_12507 [Gaeumannomyces tritici R3-111a-1]EJT69623.1 hypothetical protein GGTG_12507 [Gaeumannomyces tritici R3-111a-1]
MSGSTFITSGPGTGATAVPVPGGTTGCCAKYHLVLPGEYCNQLRLKYGISLPDFVTLNPAIKENCTNLFARKATASRPSATSIRTRAAPGTAPQGQQQQHSRGQAPNGSGRAFSTDHSDPSI